MMTQYIQLVQINVVPRPPGQKETLFHNLVANRRALHIQLNDAEYVFGPKVTFHRFSPDSHTPIIF
jgi:hypothetical protein